MYKTLLIFGLTCLAFAGKGQQMHFNGFTRSIQTVNFNLTKKETTYAQVMSAGIGATHGKKFIELATLINQSNTYGYYTLFGTALKSEALDENWVMITSVYGQVIYLPLQSESAESWTYGGGLLFFVNRQFSWGSLGIPIVIGGAWSQENFNLAGSFVLNLALNIK